MNLEKILSHCDHTLLAPDAVWGDIKQICDDGIKYKTASVCIPAAYVNQASEYVCGKVKICTVIGFPNGYSTAAVKAFEAKDAIENGADEIDMVINIGYAKSGRFDEILREIKLVKAECGNKILKVIIETCLLNDDEKIRMCEIINESGADFIKTSTGFSKSGATKEDIVLFSKHINSNVKMKAAGGIRSFEDAEDFLTLGCDRLGTSAIVKFVKNIETTDY